MCSVYGCGYDSIAVSEEADEDIEVDRVGEEEQ